MSVDNNFQFLTLRLKNYRQFGGDRTIDLRPKNGKLVNVIQGTNGSGKSNILNALNYCLYEDEPHLRNLSQSMPMVNISELQKTQVGDEIQIIIELVFGNESISYKIARKISFVKPELVHEIIDEKGNKLVKLETKDNLGSFPLGSRPITSASFQWSKGKDWTTEEHPDAQIEKLLPRAMRSFYFIDGEFLESLASTFTGVKNSVEDISHITLVNYAISNIKKVTLDFEKKTKSQDPLVDEYLDAKNNHNRWLESVNLQGDKQFDKENPVDYPVEGKDSTWYHPKSGKPRLESKQEEREFLKTRISEISTQLQKQNAPLKIEWENAIIALDKKLPKKEKTLYDLKKKKYSYIVDEGPFVYMLDSINYVCDLIDKKRNHGDLPVKYNDLFFKDLMDAKKCICGTDLSSGKARENVLSWNDRTKLDERLDVCVEVGATFKKRLASFDKEISVLDDFRNAINELEEEIRQMEDEKLEKKAKYDSVGNEAIKELNKEREAKERLLREVETEIMDLKIEIKERERKRNVAENDYTKAMNKISKLQNVQKQLEVCKKFLNNFRDIRTKIIKKFKDRVELNTKNYFFDLIWKKDTYTDVTINDDYHLKVIHKDGYDAVANLAAGERLVLALAFVAAIRTITGHKFPLVIDTPLGKLAGVQKTNVGQLLPEFLDQTQLTLLATNTEYQSPIKDEETEELFPSVRELFESNINEEYKINYNEKTGISDIGELP